MEEILRQLEGQFFVLNQVSDRRDYFDGQVFPVHQQEIASIKEAHDIIFEYIFLERKIREIELNLADYFHHVNLTVKKLKDCPESAIESIQKEAFIDINRVFTNFVVSLKSLIDDFLVKKLIPKIYGKDSPEHVQFKKLTSYWYDSSLPYKFLMRIRDYAVHVYHPITSISYDMDFDEIASPNYEVTCTPNFVKAKLFESDTMRKKLEADLAGYNDKFPVEPILEGIRPIISQILPAIICLSPDRYKEPAQFVSGWYHRFENPRRVSFGTVIRTETELRMVTDFMEGAAADRILATQCPEK